VLFGVPSPQFTTKLWLNPAPPSAMGNVKGEAFSIWNLKDGIVELLELEFELELELLELELYDELELEFELELLELELLELELELELLELELEFELEELELLSANSISKYGLYPSNPSLDTKIV
jgi:hypothetical protein